MSRSRVLVVGLVMVAALALVISSCAAPAGKSPTKETPGAKEEIGPTLTFKVSHQWAKGDVRDRMARDFGEEVEKRTDGTITFEYYPASALYEPKEQWDYMAKGALDMAVFPLAYASGKLPALDITLMPCIIPNLKEASEWYKEPIGKKINEMMEELGVMNVVWANMEGTLGAQPHQIRLPKDVEGLKMRAAGRMYENMLREAGAAITSMPSSEAYEALSKGVINALNTSCASFVSYKLFEQLEYINVPEDYSTWYMAENLCMSVESYEKMSDEQKEIFDTVSKEMNETWVPREFGKDTQNLIETYKEAGVEMHWMTEDEYQAWADLAERTSWKKFANQVEGGQELIDLAKQAAKQ